LKTDFDIVDLSRLIPIVILGIGGVIWRAFFHPSQIEEIGFVVVFLFLLSGWIIEGEFRDVKSSTKRLSDILGKMSEDLEVKLGEMSSNLHRLQTKIDDEHMAKSPEFTGGLRLIENHVHYNAGLMAGQDDRKVGKPFDANRHTEYKDGRNHAAWKLGYDEAYGRRRPETSAGELYKLLRDL